MELSDLTCHCAYVMLWEALDTFQLGDPHEQAELKTLHRNIMLQKQSMAACVYARMP